MTKCNSRNPIYFAPVFFILLAVAVYAAPTDQRTFATPQEAMQATIEASEHNDSGALRKIFGPDSKEVVESGDPVQDKEDRTEFVGLAREKTAVNSDPSNPDRVTFTIGTEDWPFPVPLVRSDGKWMFDTASGRVEVLAHRIGENELSAIDACRAFAEAQFEYAKSPRDGAGVQEYAQKMRSSPAKHDGLYWDGAPDGMLPKQLADALESGKPYHGYNFRILTAQGPTAPGGAFSYLVNGRLIGGFALVAWPAEYEVSGVKTFIISHHGIVYEKDLGRDTARSAKEMNRFEPDSSWREVHEE